MSVPGLAPACTIDFVTRDFSLPFGLPPELPDAQSVQAYITALGLEVGVRRYQGLTAASATQDPSDPGPPSARRAQACGGVTPALFPPSTPLPVAAAAAAVVVSKTQLDSVGKTTWLAAVPVAGKTTAEAAGSTFRWDMDARKAFALPAPSFAEECLVAFWSSEPTGGPALSAAVPGVLDSDAATYLLRTPTSVQDGELDGLLLRAPARSLIRFERYRHLRQVSASKLTTSHPSTAGAVVMRTLPTTLGPPESGAPLFKQSTLVLENVSVDAASASLGALAYCQVVHYAELAEIDAAKKSLNAQLTWLFRVWLAYLAVARPLVRPTDPDVTSDLDPAVRKPFEQNGTPGNAAIKAFASAALGSEPAKQSLIAFARDFYGSLLCGVSWTELGADLPADPASRPPDLKFAHEVLERIMSAPDAYLVAFAGCPVGQASQVYLQSVGPAAGDIPVQALTPFDLEGLLIAGHASDVFADVTAPSEPGVLQPYDLSGYDQRADGFMAALRVVDVQPGKHAFTALEWLGETIKGSNRGVFEDPALDFSALGGDGHPLAEPLGWGNFTRAQKLRDDLSTLGATTVGAQTLAQAIVGWWVAKTGLGLGVAGTWPTQDPFSAGVTETPAGPSAPFAPGDTLTKGSGFDVYDLATALDAAGLVRDAKDPANPPPLALFLALLNSEGYRDGARADRTGGLDSAGWKDAANPLLTKPNLAAAGVPPGGGLEDAIARLDWILFPYGLDIFNQAMTFDANCVGSARTSFSAHLDQLTADGVYTGDLPSLYAHKYALDRLTGRFSPATLRAQNRRLTRRLQLLGIGCQQAEYQDRHHRLQHADETGNPFEVVDEFVAATAPAPGTDANSDDRRKFIAYYALVYLAFNASPATFSLWVRAANEHRGAEPVSTYLLYYKNAQPRQLEPTLTGELPGTTRQLYQRANMLRFAVALDAYLRIGGAAADTADPGGRTW